MLATGQPAGNAHIAGQALDASSMRTLVLCVDRDNDLGVKAGVTGPIIGREENLKAAMALGVVDPEDVDTNTILSSIQLCDDLLRQGSDAEIATIIGDIHVGVQSDLILAAQLEAVLARVKPDRAILVSDGTEDEAVYPMISSRVKVDSVRRVFVKQAESIESLYYVFVKALQDAKLRRKFLVPAALVLLIFGLLSLTPKLIQFAQNPGGVENPANLALLSEMALGTIALALGIFTLAYAYRISERLAHWYGRTRKAARTGSLSLVFAALAGILIVVGSFLGYDAAVKAQEAGAALVAVQFFSSALWLWVFALLAYESGRSIDRFLALGKVQWGFIILMISLLATGFIVQGALDALGYFLGSAANPGVALIYAEIVTGVLVAVFGGLLNTSLRAERRAAKGGSAGNSERP